MRIHPPLRMFLSIALLLAASPAAAAKDLPDAASLRTWIEEMKASPRGPFERIRWFCKDGSVLPPKAYACRDHGGGVQHGEWNQRAQTLRAGGYKIANIYAGIAPAPFLGKSADLPLLSQMLLERFLMKVDDGWIFRGARSYRGALQAEDEEAGARALVLAMLADASWLKPERLERLRESVRLLPLPRGDEASTAKVRQLALQYAEKDRAFTPLRAKIHNVPEAQDADAVRKYAKSKAPAGMRKQYEQLADKIDELYAAGGAADALRAAAGSLQDAALAGRLREAAGKLDSADAVARLGILADVLQLLRDSLPRISSPEDRLKMLEASLQAEDNVYTTGTELLKTMGSVNRRNRLAWLGEAARSLYGVGFLSSRQLDGVRDSLGRIGTGGSLDVDGYRAELRYLARVPEWSSAWLEFNFGETIEHWRTIEPESILFNQDRMRGSPLLFYSGVIDALSLDANQLAGIEHDLFGRRVGAGLRALNPGLARGTLVAPKAAGGLAGGFSREGIYLLPESTSDLPRVSGILTRGEGSSLSHVQLLARNLGIPNVVVVEEHVPTVQANNGKQAVLAVSPQGVVRLVESGPKWDEIFGVQQQQQGNFVIRPDLEKLQIDKPALLPLTKLRATDSGRLSGPKGANLGELKHYFGDAVPDGFVVSFGVFRMLLDQPLEPGGPSVWEWMKGEYARIGRLPEAEQEAVASVFLARLRRWILQSDPGDGFKQGLRMALGRLGTDGTFGVFVRSDTNVEDLPGFTGAGLNLTVFNVVGYDNVMKAMREVWASPFTDRAYGWRQANMELPEYVFPAVVVQKAFPSEKSGVLVTVDVDTGDKGWLTVAVSEGVGGAVEGQAAESIKINTETGEVRLLAQATAPHMHALSPTGGMASIPTSGTDTVLKPAEIQKLVAFSKIVGKFPSLRDENGVQLPADVEFGFRGGELHLLQIRPLVESKAAKSNTYLSQIDAAFRERGTARVNLEGVPKEPN